MNILITGCAGFIGSSLTEKLLNDNHYNIIGIDNFDTYYPREIKEKNIELFANNKNFIFFEADILDKKVLDEIFQKYNIDTVVHLAAKAGVRNSFVVPDEYTSVNITGTVNILNLMRKYGVKKLVFASSSSVYGNHKKKIFSEDFINLKPISPYAMSKKSAEEYIKLYSEQYGINALCLRFFTVFGPKQRPDLAIRKFTENIKNNKPIQLYGDGTTYRDYTYIDNVTDGIISAINYNKAPFEIINIGSGNPIMLKDMVNAIERELNKKAIIEYLPMQNGDVNYTFADISKAEQLLGYKPKISFAEGLKRFINF